jgi:hypothetical protein
MLRHCAAALGPAWLCASLSAASVCNAHALLERTHVGQCSATVALHRVLDMMHMCRGRGEGLRVAARAGWRQR